MARQGQEIDDQLFDQGPGVGAFFAPCLRDDIELQIKTLEQNYSTTEPLGCCEMASRNTAATTTQTECQHLTDGTYFKGISFVL
ncbi:Hypothetical predicted protein [Mytilus galloprovincialis]|uniref:Uncharacterized protein n=1 Tax=Mytilus galloprovincialis TaxID=29158 RepID=A0A8B6HPV6_MYTGA|nr:Hypothetical predicted protein [Mytilus galloprovincialis]